MTPGRIFILNEYVWIALVDPDGCFGSEWIDFEMGRERMHCAQTTVLKKKKRPRHGGLTQGMKSVLCIL